MSMFFKKTPRHPIGFWGYLHDCDVTKISSTTNDLHAVPKIDKDRWKQYCFRGDTEFEYHLGEKRIYVEFHVDWNEWIDVQDVDWINRISSSERADEVANVTKNAKKKFESQILQR